MPKRSEDEYTWAKKTAQALRAGNLSAIDVKRLAEEIEDTVFSRELEVSICLKEVIESLLKLNYTKIKPKATKRELGLAQASLQRVLESNPSLRATITGPLIEHAYDSAREIVEQLADMKLPPQCPFRRETILEDPLDRLRAEGRLVSA